MLAWDDNRPLFVGHPHIRIFPDDVDLLDPLFVEFVKIVVVVLFVAALVVLDTFDPQSVVQYHKAAFKVQDSGFREEKTTTRRDLSHHGIGLLPYVQLVKRHGLRIIRVLVKEAIEQLACKGFVFR